MALGVEMAHSPMLPTGAAQEATAVLKRVPLELVQELVQCAADELVREQLLGDARAQTTTATLQSKWEALGLESSGLRNVYAMVASALVTLARENEPSVTVQKQILTSFGLAEDDALASALLEALAKVIPSVQSVLEQSSFDFAHVVDVSWRLDYVLRSSSAGKIHEPLYFVQIKLQPPSGPLQDLSFACSVDELRDLVYRLQEATNIIERLMRSAAAA